MADHAIGVSLPNGDPRNEPNSHQARRNAAPTLRGVFSFSVCWGCGTQPQHTENDCWNEGFWGKELVIWSMLVVCCILFFMAEAAAPLDGRHERRRQNVEAVVDAIYELWSEGNLKPGAQQIAERSGVSLRSVFRYFDDLESLVDTAIERHMHSTDHHFELLAPVGTLQDRAAEYAAHRVRRHYEMRGVSTATRIRAPFHAQLAEVLRHRERQVAAQIALLFEDELAKFDEAGREERVAAVEALVSEEGMEIMDRIKHFAPDRVEKTLLSGLLLLLS